MAKSHPEARRYLYRFHPSNEILMRLYEIFETGKKQNLTPLMREIVPATETLEKLERLEC